MLWQSMEVLSKTPGGARCILKYLESLTMVIAVSGRFVYSFWTKLHFADKESDTTWKNPSAAAT